MGNDPTDSVRKDDSVTDRDVDIGVKFVHNFQEHSDESELARRFTDREMYSICR